MQRRFYGSTPHTGWSPTRWGLGPRVASAVVANTQVVCQQCPSSTAVGVSGAAGSHSHALSLRGASVLSAQADTEPGDPMFADVISRIFPPSLKVAANEAKVPHIQALLRQAAALAGC